MRLPKNTQAISACPLNPASIHCVFTEGTFCSATPKSKEMVPPWDWLGTASSSQTPLRLPLPCQSGAVMMGLKPGRSELER